MAAAAGESQAGVRPSWQSIEVAIDIGVPRGLPRPGFIELKGAKRRGRNAQNVQPANHVGQDCSSSKQCSTASKHGNASRCADVNLPPAPTRLTMFHRGKEAEMSPEEKDALLKWLG